MKYLPYFCIVLILILLVLVALLWLKPDPDPKLAIVAIEREVSEEALKAKGMDPELLQELKNGGVDPRFLLLLVEAEDENRHYYIGPLSELSKEALQTEYRAGKEYLDQALDHRGLEPAAINKLSMEELKDIYDSHRQKVWRYWDKFNLIETRHKYDARMKALAQSSIFSYEGDGKIRVSIPRDRMSSEQKEYLQLIEAHRELVRRGISGIKTKIVVQSDPEAVKITCFQDLVSHGIRGGDSIQFVIDRKIGKRIGRVTGGGD